MCTEQTELDRAMHDALVRVAAPLFDEQAAMRAQLGAYRLLLTLLYADRFREDQERFDQLMSRMLRLVPQALVDLPGGPHSPEALAAQNRVNCLLLNFQESVDKAITAANPRQS